MHFIRPSWLAHTGDRKNHEVYSAHVSPDGQRLATGGQDGIVRIWSTTAILRSVEPVDPGIPKQLCSLSHHSGAVLTVRFSGNNRFLASGSDDKIVLVYERDLSAPPSRPVFGSNEAPHTETWRTHRRLAGHDNDVQDLGWSADCSILVSVGLDSKVIVWSGSTFERLKKIDIHQSHVKGITFDPANKYFATASDDRTIKVVRFTPPPANANAIDQATNFVVEQTITGPFAASPLTTYFRRCSWSPDGSHIAAANAVNGPVSSVAIINRGTWDSEINLIGHEGPVEVCAFAPRMFSKMRVENGAKEQTPVTVIACAGQDKALSIWNTSNPRPLIITQDLAQKAISDLAWSPDGSILFTSSLDGSVVCICFEEGDLGFVLPVEENDRILQKFGAGRRGATLPEGTESVRLEELSKAGERKDVEGRMGQLMMDGRNGVNGGDISMTNAGDNVGPQWQIQQPVPQADTEVPIEKEKEKPFKQKITITKDGKKRVAPLLVSTGGGQRSNLPNPQVMQAQAGASGANRDPNHTLDLTRPYDGLPRGGLSSLILGNKRRAVEDGEDGAPPHVSNGKRVSIISSADEAFRRAGETPDFIRPAVISPALTTSQVRLAVPKVRTFVNRAIDPAGKPLQSIPKTSSELTSSQDTLFEARNSTAAGEREPTRLTIARGAQVIWMDFLRQPVLLVTGNNNFWCAACEDGSLHIYSPIGRRLLNPIVIESQPCLLDCRGWWLMCLTAVGVAHIWNIKTNKSPHPPVSLAPIFDVASTFQKSEGLSRGEAVTEAAVNSEGTLVISLSNGDGYAYSHDMYSWQKLTEAWWAIGSQYWDTSGSSSKLVSDGPSSTSTTTAATSSSSSNKNDIDPAISAGVIPHLERRTTNEVLINGRGRFLQRVVKQVLSREGFEGFETAVSIAHLENRIAAARALNARDEFRAFLFMYARRLAAEGMKPKVEALLRELMGRLDEDEADEEEKEPDQWVGWDRRELLRGVLLAIGKHRDLQRITVPYAKILGIMEDQMEEDSVEQL